MNTNNAISRYGQRSYSSSSSHQNVHNRLNFSQNDYRNQYLRGTNVNQQYQSPWSMPLLPAPNTLTPTNYYYGMWNANYASAVGCATQYPNASTWNNCSGWIPSQYSYYNSAKRFRPDTNRKHNDKAQHEKNNRSFAHKENVTISARKFPRTESPSSDSSADIVALETPQVFDVSDDAEKSLKKITEQRKRKVKDDDAVKTSKRTVSDDENVSIRPEGVFPGGVQPQNIVLVIDEDAPYIDLPHFSQMGYKILSGCNIDACNFLKLIKNDNSFLEDNVLYVIIPYFGFFLKDMNLFHIVNNKSVLLTDEVKKCKSNVKYNESNSFLSIVKDFANEILPDDLSVLYFSDKRGDSSVDRNRSVDEHNYAEYLITSRLIHAALRLRSGVTSSTLNSEVVFAGFPVHAMRATDIVDCFNNFMGVEHQLRQCANSILNSLKTFNQFATNTWKLGYWSRLSPSFNVELHHHWGCKDTEVTVDSALEIEIISQHPKCDFNADKLSERENLSILPCNNECNNDIIEIVDISGNDNNSAIDSTRELQKDSEFSAIPSENTDLLSKAITDPHKGSDEIELRECLSVTEKSMYNEEIMEIPDRQDNAVSNKSETKVFNDNPHSKTTDHLETLTTPAGAAKCTEITSNADDLMFDDDAGNVLDIHTDELIDDIDADACVSEAERITSSCSAKNGSLLEQLPGTLSLSLLSQYQWVQQKLSGTRRREASDKTCCCLTSLNVKLDDVRHWYTDVLSNLLNHCCHTMKDKGSFLVWQPPRAAHYQKDLTETGAVACNIKAGVFLECQDLEQDGAKVSYTCEACHEELSSVDAADIHAYTEAHNLALLRLFPDESTSKKKTASNHAIDTLLGKQSCKNFHPLHPEYIRSMERAGVVEKKDGLFCCLVCDELDESRESSDTEYLDGHELRRHVNEQRHRMLLNEWFGISSNAKKLRQFEQWKIVKMRLKKHPVMKVVIISDDMNYSVLKSLTHFHANVLLWTFPNLLRDGEGRESAVLRWQQLSSDCTPVLWLIVAGIDLLVTSVDVQESPEVDKIVEHLYAVHSYLRVNVPTSHVVLTAPVLPLNILIDTLPQAFASSLMNSSNSIVVSEEASNKIQRPYELIFSRSLAIHAANAAHENVHRLAKSAVCPCVVRVLDNAAMSETDPVPQFFTMTPWHVAVEGLILGALEGLPAPYLLDTGSDVLFDLALRDLEESSRLSRAVIVGDIKFSQQSQPSKQKLVCHKRRLDFSEADLAYVLEYAGPAGVSNPITWCMTAPVPAFFMSLQPNLACVKNRCPRGLRTWVFNEIFSCIPDAMTIATLLRTFLTKLQSKLPRGNFANLFPVYPIQIICYRRIDLGTHKVIHALYERFPNVFFTKEPIENVRETVENFKEAWKIVFATNKLGHGLLVNEYFSCINVYSINQEMSFIEEEINKQKIGWLKQVNGYFADYDPDIKVSLSPDSSKGISFEPPPQDEPEQILLE